jgi:hypothetical protein
VAFLGSYSVRIPLHRIANISYSPMSGAYRNAFIDYAPSSYQLFEQHCGRIDESFGWYRK